MQQRTWIGNEPLPPFGASPKIHPISRGQTSLLGSGGGGGGYDGGGDSGGGVVFDEGDVKEECEK